MKKYLMTGMAALAMCAAFTSCSKDTTFEQITPEQAIEASYESAFIKAFGQPAPNQDWGFGTTTRGITRGDSDCGDCYKYDMQYDTPSFPKTGHPAPISASERAYVKNWFETNPGLSEVGLDIHNFYIQHVWGEPNKDYNVRNEDTGKVEVNKGTMDYCEVGDGTNYTHVKDFNANGPGSFGIVYMRNSSALSFGFHATWGDNRDYHNFKLAHIVGTAEDGTKIDGWYVGLAMYGEKWDNGTKVLNYDQLNYADDWILKIVPGEGEITEYQGRIMAEDLTVRPNGEASDFDFNDVVFDWKIEGNVATIQLRATGGTLPLYVGGQEVHDKFGVSRNTMVNTGVSSAEEPAPYTYTFPTGVEAIAKNIPIVVTNNGQDVELKAEEGKVASKINVPTGTRWVKEYQDIKNAYPGFQGWVADPSAEWTSNSNSAFLY